MKRVLMIAMLSSLLFAGGCCCPGPFLHRVGNFIFGPWTCGNHGGSGPCGQCAEGCYSPGGHYGDGCGCGNPCGNGCGGGQGAANYGAGCGGGCSWYNTGCNSCCGGWGCGDIYLTDLFHPICDPCWWGGGYRRGGCCGYDNGCGRGYGYGGGCDSYGSPGYADSGCGGAPCGEACGGPYTAAAPRGAWTASAAGPGPCMAQGPQGTSMAQRPCSSGDYSMTAQAVRGPWETAGVPRGQWAMNRDYVVSQPKVVDDRVVESRPKTPAKKTAQTMRSDGEVRPQ